MPRAIQEGINEEKLLKLVENKNNKEPKDDSLKR